ncbi:type II toxin-antitoxin system RelE/ParE family toxin [Pasteurellaceae bacterium 20609_3]|uniref:type II toxin-antitoxin system RelE/ParE family toxin n=1 Tax=Spirabiliibacterium mucosae TaxID=28156 RepID=UPI001AAC50BA|nr:type II toxin-antitoxin system RelE/ParE family toxin [Spirabiliibacterium mucosae]MBE2897477.1 type II toxin-antitoxin system RelE/ParE family toxin [Spirabiliibacterium mucosae]
MKVTISTTAAGDLVQIYRSISDYVGSISAEKVLDDIYSSILLALTQPEMGAQGAVPNTRELFPRGGKYRVVYQVRKDELYIITILLSKKKYP